jgi:cell division protein FtsL
VANLCDAVGGYFLFRFLIRSDEDIARALKVLAVVAAVAAVSMVHEQRTLQNWFGQLGGIRMAPEVRNTRIRAQAFFQHALIAGSFGATMFPLFLWLLVRGKAWLFGGLGAAAALVMVLTASTSTPILALLGAILAICLWPVRKKMRWIRWGMVAALIELQIVMKAPVWFAIGHIDLSGGSTGWDRAMLIDNFLGHFGSWWLIGTHANVNWGWDMWDECNQFVAEGFSGGLVCFICFVAMFTLCFKHVGRARKMVSGRGKQEWLIWLFGAGMFAQAMAYLGIDYFDQSKFVWYLLLVMLATTTSAVFQEHAARRAVPAELPVADLGALPELPEPSEVNFEKPHWA